jgi:hypothetical protein
VRFKNGSATLCKSVKLAKGTARCKTTTARLGVGKHVLAAAYSGDSNYSASSSSINYTVTKKVSARKQALRLSAVPISHRSRRTPPSD